MRKYGRQSIKIQFVALFCNTKDTKWKILHDHRHKSYGLKSVREK